MRKLWLIPLIVLLLVCSCLLFGCGDLGYYLQSASGQMEIIAKRQPIQKLLENDSTDPALKQRLLLALKIRRFAVDELGLPDNESYRSYADLKRPYVVWNVVATPEFSLEPVTWCYPVIGCLPYRGYYNEADARQYAAKLDDQGDDTVTYGVTAYSTLNWFSDPILNTFNRYSETYLAGMIFHELAHQLVYIKGQAAFNEAYAETVETVGVERWLAKHGQSGQTEQFERSRAAQQEFIQLAQGAKLQLEALYQRTLPPEQTRRQKAEVLRLFQQQLRKLRDRHHLGMTAYQSWLSPKLNNAQFASLATYHDLKPAFEQLLRQQGGDMRAFNAEVKRLAKLTGSERNRVMTQLASLDRSQQKHPDTRL